MKKTLLVTGCAGFIAFDFIKKIKDYNYNIIGIDNLDNYYDPNLKRQRLLILKKIKNFFYYKLDINDYNKVRNFFQKNKIDHVVHLAAQPGVGYSLINPKKYIKTNIVGFFNMIHLSKIYKVKHFIYASSSSVYGLNKKFPLKESDNTEFPVSLYGATKKSNELIAHVYSHIYKMKTTGLRFFTAYGPWGRPDMSYFKFVKSILNNKIINIYNYGKYYRDFTYVENISNFIINLLKKSKFKKEKLYQIYNVGGGNSIKLINYIKAIENILKIKAKKNFLPMQKGDVLKTLASQEKSKKIFNFSKNNHLSTGLKKYISWFKAYYLNEK